MDFYCVAWAIYGFRWFVRNRKGYKLIVLTMDQQNEVFRQMAIDEIMRRVRASARKYRDEINALWLADAWSAWNMMTVA